jgi:hypothetical protein
MASIATAFVALIGAAGAVGVSADTAHADTATNLPIKSYAHMAVADGHVFFSGGGGSNGILVTDYDGNIVTTITGEPGANGMAVSADGNTVYVALSNGDAVAAIDATTMTETARYATGAGTAPVSVAVAAGKVWFSYSGANVGQAGIGSLNPSSTPVAIALNQTGDSWYAPPQLSASDANGGVLAAAEGGSPVEMATYNLSTSPVTRNARQYLTKESAANLGALRVTPDGNDVLVASGAPYFFQVYKTADLSDDGVYPGSNYPSAVAVAPDGTVAGGLSSNNPDVYVYTPGSAVLLNTFQAGGESVAWDGLAWAPDESRLFEVTGGPFTSYRLHVLLNPKLTITSIDLKAPAPVVPGQPVTLAGTLSSLRPLPAGTALHVTRSGPADSTPTPVPDVTTAADGTFTITDATATAEGSYGYQVSYDGDAGHRSATASVTASVARLDATMQLTWASASTPGPVAMNGQLAGSPYPSGETVQVKVSDPADSGVRRLPDVALGTDGSFHITDSAQAEGWYDYSVSYAGDATHKPSTGTFNAYISKYNTTTYLSAPSSAPRGSLLSLSGTVSGGTALSAPETVQVVKYDLANPNGVSLGLATVQTDGSYSFTDTPAVGGTNTYQVEYAGDTTHSGSSTWAEVQVSRAATSLSVTTNAHSYAYAGWAKVTVHLGTTANSRAVSLQAIDANGTVIANRSGTVDAQGNQVTWVRVGTRTTFSASFAGDYQFAPATAQTSAYVSAGVFQAQRGYYTSAWYGKTLYRVYHHTTQPVLAAALAPNKSGQCVYFALQEYSGGRWHSFPYSSCFQLNANSATGVMVNLGSWAVGHLFRIDSFYRGDSANLGVWGTWQYFAVKR